MYFNFFLTNFFFFPIMQKPVIYLQTESIGWLLYDKNLRHERVKSLENNPSMKKIKEGFEDLQLDISLQLDTSLQLDISLQLTLLTAAKCK